MSFFDRQVLQSFRSWRTRKSRFESRKTPRRQWTVCSSLTRTQCLKTAVQISYLITTIHYFYDQLDPKKDSFSYFLKSLALEFVCKIYNSFSNSSFQWSNKVFSRDYSKLFQWLFDLCARGSGILGLSDLLWFDFWHLFKFDQSEI